MARSDAPPPADGGGEDRGEAQRAIEAPTKVPPGSWRRGAAGAVAVWRRAIAAVRRVPTPFLIAVLLAGPVTLTSLVLLLVSPRAASVAPAPRDDRPIADRGTPEAGPEDGGPRDGEGEGDGSVVLGPVRAPLFRVGALAGDPAIVLSEVTLGKRPVAQALAAAGVAKPEVVRLLSSFATLRSFDRSSPRDTFALAREKGTGRVVAFEYATSPFDVWQARRSGDDAFEASKLALRVERVPVAASVLVGEDLRASIVAAGLDDDMVSLLDDALHGHVELSSVRPGARLRIVALEDRVEGAFTRYAELEAVEYVPAAGAPLRLYHYGGPLPVGASAAPRLRDGSGYYDGKGRKPYGGGWRSPVPLARISSRYNPRRVHPVLHIVMPHTGVDYAAPPGTPVYATAAGSVTSVGDGGPCGRMVQILHSNGLTSAYCHLSRFAAGLHGGQHVEGRQLVGYVGQSGRATGPHLHFAVKRGDIFLDPMALRLDGVRVVPPEGRDEFSQKRAVLDGRLDAVALPPPAGLGDGGAPAEDAGEPQEVIYDPPP